MDLPPIVVTGSSGGFKGISVVHLIRPLGSIPGGSGGSGGTGEENAIAAPNINFVPECDTGEPEIDETAEWREQLWAEGQGDGSLPLEEAALFWPDGQGGYDMLQYGVDIAGGGPGPCGFAPPPADSFPSAGEWPSGAIFFHTHPYSPGTTLPDTCQNAAGNLIAGAGPSPGDPDHVQWLRDQFRDDVRGIVMDPNAIYEYGAEQSEDEPPTIRCD